MKIACLQFAPQIGDVDNNMNRADAVLSKANPTNLDLLVLPELAFSGYNFRSLKHITPYLEHSSAGISSLWARTTALKYDCVVTVGYPEKVDITPKWPASPEYYNSAITVNRDGHTIANYRKSFLYYTDETWALEGPDGFYVGVIDGLGNTAMGICMDLNPYKFEAPWNSWEFAYHILHKGANLVVLAMAWLTREDPRSYSRTPKEPDMDTLSYWLMRLEPLIRAETEGEIIVVFANRCGTEDEAVYAGTSAVIGIDRGEVKVYGILGRGERELLVVDTDSPPVAKLVADHGQPKVQQSEASQDSMQPLNSSRRYQAGATMRGSTPLPEEIHVSIDGVLSGAVPLSPISPVDAFSSHSYFSGDSLAADEILGLKSSTNRKDTPAPRRATPAPVGHDTFERPSSPKSRNASRTRNPVIREPALATQDLINEPKVAKIPIVMLPGQPTPHSADDAVPVPVQDWDMNGSLDALKISSENLRPRSVGW